MKTMNQNKIKSSQAQEHDNLYADANGEIKLNKYRMDIDGYGAKTSITFETIVAAENEEQAAELGMALADKYAEIYDREEEWSVNNIELMNS